MKTDRVTITDIRSAGYCAPGLRRQCKALGLDIRRLVNDGIPIEELEMIDDVTVQRCVAEAKRRIANER